MHTSAPSLFSRDDTFFGVCEALGEDFGFNPLWLRLALAFGVFWNPVAVVVGYLAVGVAVLLSRLLFPSRRATAEVPRLEEAKPIAGGNDQAPVPTAIAA